MRSSSEMVLFELRTLVDSFTFHHKFIRANFYELQFDDIVGYLKDFENDYEKIYRAKPKRNRDDSIEFELVLVDQNCTIRKEKLKI